MRAQDFRVGRVVWQNKVSVQCLDRLGRDGRGGAWLTIRQRSSSSPFCMRSSWAVLAWAGMSTLWRCPSSISTADHARCRPPSAVPWRMALQRLSRRVTCPNNADAEIEFSSVERISSYQRLILFFKSGVMTVALRASATAKKPAFLFAAFLVHSTSFFSIPFKHKGRYEIEKIRHPLALYWQLFRPKSLNYAPLNIVDLLNLKQYQAMMVACVRLFRHLKRWNPVNVIKCEMNIKIDDHLLLVLLTGALLFTYPLPESLQAKTDFYINLCAN